MMRLLHSVGGLVAVVAFGCAPGPEVIPLGPPTGSVIRFVEHDAEERLDSRSFVDYQPLFHWPMHEASEVASWSPRNIDLRFDVAHEGLVLQSSTIDPQLVRPVDFDAATVNVIQISMTRSTTEYSENPQLFWAHGGEDFSPDRSARPTYVGEGGHYVFDVSKHPRWSGHIERIRVDPTSIAGRRVSIQHIDGLRKRLNAKGLDEVRRRAWKVDLGHDVRNALLVPPETSLTHSLTIPAESELRFALGVWQELATSVVGIDLTVRLSFQPLGSTPQTLYEWQPGATSWTHEAEWHEASVDLRPFAHEEGRLTLEATTHGRHDVLAALPVWAHPEIVMPADHRRPNVILISIDTLRADHLSLYGYDETTSPHIDAWAQRAGVTFETVVAQAPWTLPSHVSIFTGLDPISHAVNHERPMPSHLVTLAEVLRDAGYATRALTDGVYLDPEYGFTQGFDAYGHQGTVDAFHEGTLSRGVDQALRYMKRNRERPFFLFLHTYEVHGPYRLRHLDTKSENVRSQSPDRAIALYPQPVSSDLVLRYEPHWRESSGSASVPLTEEEFGQVATYYDEGIRFTDRQLAPLFEYLDASGLEEETIVVVTSDHGEALGEGGRFGHAYLSDDNLLVPLVIAYPNRLPAGRRIPAQVRSVDILPTVLDLAQVAAPSAIDGATLTPLVDGDASVGRDAWSYGPNTNVGLSVRTGDGFHYIFNNTAFSSLAGHEQLHVWPADGQDLQSISTAGERAESLRARLHRRLEQGSGLRIRVLNRGSSTVEGVLQSPAINRTTVKSGEACGCVAWEGPGRVRVRVPAATAYTVVLEDVEDSTIRVTGTLAVSGATQRPVPFDVALDQDHRQPILLELSGQEWSEASRESDIFTGLKIWRAGDRRGVSPSAREMPSPGLLSQLQALGYIR